MDKMILKFLEQNGYTDIRIIGNRLCGLHRFAFTTGLVVGLEMNGYYGRYCYESHAEAKAALLEWDGNGDPNGNWIKYKGEGGERTNPNSIQ